MGYPVTRLSLWHLAYDLHICERDVQTEPDLAARNNAAIRMLCAVRQIGLRFGRAW